MIRRALVAMAMVALVSSCAGRDGRDPLLGGAESLCGERAIPRSAVPVPEGFRIHDSALVEPIGCGASYLREATVGAPADSTAAPADRYVDALLAQGWLHTACARPWSACLDDGRHVIAVDGRGSVVAVTVQPSSST
ncbi:MAG TPA: hypothetical protein VHK88_02885 [Aquihabitans sp.]|nr:hypothetical protein [Aquihabitans sp.]